MQNTSLLLQRHEETFSGPDTLIVDVDDPELGELLPGAALHTDLFGIRDAVPAPLPTLESRHRRALVILPKSRERLVMLLEVLAGQSGSALEVWLVGPAKGGIRGGVTALKRYADDVEQVDSARHCKLFRGWLRPGDRRRLDDFAARWRHGDLELESYPGVFSHGRGDEGTLELLPFIERGQRRVLDIGCGYGLLSASLAAAGAEVCAVDRSATAVAATEATLARNDLAAEVRGSDLYQRIDGRFAEIWSNPPFHEGMRRTLSVTERLIRQAPDYLDTGGSLILVANVGLPYEPVMRESFKKVRELQRTRRFVVLRGSL